MMNGELESILVYCTETDCLREPLLSITVTVNGDWSTYRYLSSNPIEWWKVCRHLLSEIIEL